MFYSNEGRSRLGRGEGAGRHIKEGKTPLFPGSSASKHLREKENT